MVLPDQFEPVWQRAVKGAALVRPYVLPAMLAAVFQPFRPLEVHFRLPYHPLPQSFTVPSREKWLDLQDHIATIQHGLKKRASPFKPSSADT